VEKAVGWKNQKNWIRHWNKLSNQIIQLFSNYFKIKNIEHVASVEGDGYVRYFYSVLMEKKQI